jgi:mannosyltransferase
VVTRLEGVTDTLIEDGVSGLLVPPRDEAALEGALAGLMQQPDKVRKMGARARERVSDDFAITDTARAYVAAYKELAAS